MLLAAVAAALALATRLHAQQPSPRVVTISPGKGADLREILPSSKGERRGRHASKPIRPFGRLVLALTLVLPFALAACNAHGDGWKRRDDGSAAGLADIEDCHAEARREAEARYPPKRLNQGGVEMTFENQDLFPAELSFFERCMRRKGFDRP